MAKIMSGGPTKNEKHGPQKVKGQKLGYADNKAGKTNRTITKPEDNRIPGGKTVKRSPEGRGGGR